LNVLDEAGAFQCLLSRDGSWASFDLVPQNSPHPSLTSPQLLTEVFPLRPEDSPQTQLVFSHVTIAAVDDDADGLADRLTGTGDGGVIVSHGDYGTSPGVTLTLSGTPDRSPPALNLPNAPLNPMDVLSITSSEALQTATLALTGTKSIPLAGMADLAWQTSFSVPEVLPFGGTWTVSGDGRDFAGFALDLSKTSFSTHPDPGIFAQDGFETAPNVTLVGAAQVVDGADGLPIPSGQHALLLPQGTSAIFHLKRTSATAKTVSARLVGLRTAGGTTQPRLRAAVIGGTERSYANPPPGAAAWSPTSNPAWAEATEPATVQAPLMDAGDDVIVYVEDAACPSFPSYCRPGGALLIDDLKLE
jgi:hypothetical protein